MFADPDNFRTSACKVMASGGSRIFSKVHTLRSGINDPQFAHDNFKCIFCMKIFVFWFYFHWRYVVPDGSVENKTVIVQLMAWWSTRIFASPHSMTGNIPHSKVHGANMVPIWGRQDPGGPHVGPVNFAIWNALVSAPYASCKKTLAARIYFRMQIITRAPRK